MGEVMRKAIVFSICAVVVTVLLEQLNPIARSWAQVVPTPGSATFRYDSNGRVVQDAYPLNSGAYSYDAAGNRITATQN